MSRVPLIVPLWVLGILLVVAAGAILIAWGLWLRLMLRRHDKDRNTN